MAKIFISKLLRMDFFLIQDSDGNNADDDSVNSFISSSINLNTTNNTTGNMDEIPTRDLGPERPGQHYSQVSFLN